MLDPILVDRLDELAAATGPQVTVAALVLATLTEHLPGSADDAAELIAARYAERLQAGRPTGTERNVRLPETLRLRLDELVRAAKERVTVASRSALVDAILARHLPSDPDDASRRVVRALIALIDTGQSRAGELAEGNATQPPDNAA